MSESGADRRKYHRIETDQVISFAEMDRSDRSAVGKDLSRGGIRFEVVGCEIELGEVLRITFKLMDQTLVATGVVVWATEIDSMRVDVGIEFIEVDPIAQYLLDESLQSDPDQSGVA